MHINPVPVMVWATFVAGAAIVTPWLLIGAALVVIAAIASN